MKKPLVLGILFSLVLFCSCDPDKKVRENPLIAEWTGEFGLPPFGKIVHADYGPAIEYAAKLHAAEVKVVAENKEAPSFDNVILPLDSAGRRLDLVMRLFSLAGAVDADRELDSLESVVARSMAAHNDAIFHDADLFGKVKAVYDGRFASGMDSLQIRLTEMTYDRFLRNGAALSDANKKILSGINGELAVHEVVYGNNLLDARNRTLVVADSAQIDGLPVVVRNNASRVANEARMPGRFVFTQDDPVVGDVLMFATDAKLRNDVFESLERLGASDSLRGNSEEVEDIVRLRNEKAKLLGYGTYAAYAAAGNMAGSVGNIYNMLDGIWYPALDKTGVDLDGIQSVRPQSDTLPLERGDWDFYLALLRKRKTTVDQEQFWPYFTLDNVRLGAFNLCNRLFGLTFRPIPADLYYADCEAYEVFDADNSHLGIIIFDYYTRPGKRSGSQMHCIRPRWPYGGEYADPVVCLSFNFVKSTNPSRPASLSFIDVEDMFRQMGNAAEVLFVDVPYAGFLSPEPDFKGVTGELLSHWAFEPQMLASYAIHYSSGKPISANNITRLHTSRNYRRAYDILRSAASAYLDMDTHMSAEGLSKGIGGFEYEQLYVKHGLPENISPLYGLTNFGQSFGSGDGAGFYGRLWSASLAADIFDMFAQRGNVYDRKIARMLREDVLSKGGSVPASGLFRELRGRDVSLSRFLYYNGLAGETVLVEPEQETEPVEEAVQPQDTLPAPVPALELWKTGRNIRPHRLRPENTRPEPRDSAVLREHPDADSVQGAPAAASPAPVSDSMIQR